LFILAALNKIFLINGQWLRDRTINSPGGSTLQWSAGEDGCLASLI